MRLEIISESMIIFAHVDDQYEYSANDQVYISVNLSACYFFESEDELDVNKSFVQLEYSI